MSGSLFSIGVSGLQLAQMGLNTTSHNIANVNTAGFSRQRVEQVERNPFFTGGGFLGQGTESSTVIRYFDNFLSQELRNSASSFTELDKYHALAGEVDELLADASVGLQPVLRDFFDAVHEVADDPASLPARQVLLSASENLMGRFQALGTQLEAMRARANSDLESAVADVNTYADGIAELNSRIVFELGRGGGVHAPNDLLDQRDQLLAQLAEKVNVKTIEMADGSLNVFIGSGQSLVQGANASHLDVLDGDPDPEQKEIALVNGASTTIVTNLLDGGLLGGIRDFVSQVLDPAQNELGRVATGLVLEFNAQHRLGYDLQGDTGIDFFTSALGANPPYATVMATSGSTGSVTVAYDLTTVGNLAPAELQASDYRLDYVQSTGTFSLTRLSDDFRFTPNATGTFNVDGLNIAAPTVPTTDSQFLIRPVHDASNRIGLAIADPRDIAAAESLGTDPITLAPIPLVGDNGNALKLAALETKKSMLGGSASLEDTYGQLVSNVGSRTHSAQINRDAQKVLHDRSVANREELAGVNLDEEAANLLNYQRAYQASAQVVATINSVFDILFDAVR
ncbi:MAG TPA: flagellar hook-associated protein FlgK [Methylococcaceae bacterium]|nr:flagellar hook-associated protein FlgK [Methylococcaceae bacterium]